MKISIGTVAKKAGVSKTTVSRFINGKYEHMSTVTREKISQAVSELNYRPNSYGAKARSGSKMEAGVLNRYASQPQEVPVNPLIGIIASGIAENAEFVRGAIETAENMGYRVVLTKGYIAQVKFDWLIADSSENLSGIPKGDTVCLAGAASEGQPCVVSVLIDHYSGLEKAIRYFSEQSFDVFSNFTSGSGSCETFNKALAEVLQGFSLELDETVLIKKNSYESCIGALTALLMKNRGQKVAVFVESDALMCFLYSLQQLKLRVPEEVGVCVYGTLGSAANLPSGIGYVEVPYYKAGAECVRVLSENSHNSRGKLPNVCRVGGRNEMALSAESILESWFHSPSVSERGLIHG